MDSYKRRTDGIIEINIDGHEFEGVATAIHYLVFTCGFAYGEAQDYISELWRDSVVGH